MPGTSGGRILGEQAGEGGWASSVLSVLSVSLTQLAYVWAMMGSNSHGALTEPNFG